MVISAKAAPTALTWGIDDGSRALLKAAPLFSFWLKMEYSEGRGASARMLALAKAGRSFLGGGLAVVC
jgi:hypothetical protein